MLSTYLKTSYAFIIPPGLGFLVLLGISLVSLVKGRRRRPAILLSAICFMGALINLDVALVNIVRDKELAIAIDRFTYIFFVFSLPVYIQFVHSFLGIHGRKKLEYAAYFVSVVFLILTPTDLFIEGFSEYNFGTIARAGKAFHLFSASAALTLVYCVYTLFNAMRQATDNVLKNRIRYILWGLGLSSLLIGFNILPVSGVPVYPLGNFSFLPALVLAVGVLKYDLLDMGAAIRRGVIYSSLTFILTVVYSVIITILNFLFMGSPAERTVFLPLILAVLMVMLFNPIRLRVQSFIDGLFFRGRYDYRKLLIKVSGELTSLLDFTAIVQLLLATVERSLGVDHARLFVYDGEQQSFLAYEKGKAEPISTGIGKEHPWVRYMKDMQRPMVIGDRERRVGMAEEDSLPETISGGDKVHLVVPLTAKGDIVGMLVLGQKRSGELFMEEDVELLTTVANQTATALENARMYRQLAELNRELERKVEERTAELRAAMTEMERTQQQLIRSESLAAIGQLVAGTAHELNNPLAGASSLVQTSLETVTTWPVDEQEKAEIVEDLRFAVKELRRAGEIVGSLLDLSRQTQTYVEPVNMNTVLDNALRVLHNQMKRQRINIQKDYDPALPTLEGNFANLGQVFINIIKNAVEALSNGEGIITLTTRYDEVRDEVVVTCRDTGTGIAPERLHDIFKPFYTTKPVGRGTGLGLYISHEIVRRHGGIIEVESEIGYGSTFRITIPRRRKEG